MAVSGLAIPAPFLIGVVVLGLVTPVWGSLLGFPIKENPFDYKSDNYRLEGHIGLTLKAHMVTVCAQRCDLHPGCESFNFYQKDERCELNLASDSESNAVTYHPGSKYIRKGTYSIQFDEEGVCTNNPCQNGGWCMEMTTSEGVVRALCDCEKGWSGQYCTHKVDTLEWSDWSDWGQCSASCGTAFRNRVRACISKNDQTPRRTLDCYGSDVEFEQCSLPSCPEWKSWSDWSACSTNTKCGKGFMVRQRECSNGGQPGVDRLCKGPTNETTTCQNPDCDAPLHLDNYSEGVVKFYDKTQGLFLPVCGDQWTLENAKVACRQLGFLKSAQNVYTVADIGFTDNISNYGLSGVQCSGTERTIQACPHSDWTMDVSCESGSPAVVKCIVDGSWNNWSSWGECSVTCAEGVRKRTRLCDHPAPSEGGVDCAGTAEDFKTCNETICPVNGYYLPWSPWGECTLSCGGGKTTRNRTCMQPQFNGDPCPGDPSETKDCNTHECPVDGSWLPWTEWTACNVSCGGGHTWRTRECNAGLHGGKNCTGDSMETETCNIHNCPIDCVWNEWTEWETCNMTCGDGHQRRIRTENVTAQYGGVLCPGDGAEWQACKIRECPVDGYWGDWQSWSVCDPTCGNGTRSRTRTCFSGLHGGQNCTGDGMEEEFCKIKECPVDGEWLEWSEWTTCSVTCANGTTTRNRVCIEAEHGGKDCEGDAEETKLCNLGECPVDGYYEEWSDWSSCSATCNNGTWTRSRECRMPAHGGNPCEGEADQMEICAPDNCPIDGYYGDWSEWSDCSVTCENGTRTRNRSCTPPQYGGESCDGPPDETEACTKEICPVDGQWSDWSAWTTCTVTCGNGTTYRNRSCEGRVGAGAECQGEGEEITHCGEPCPDPGYFDEWAEWATCSITCGGGTKSRTRTCIKPSPLSDPCEGETSEEGECNTYSCDEYHATCTELKDLGLADNVNVQIDPARVEPIEVFCNMNDLNGIGITEIQHDQQEDITITPGSTTTIDISYEIAIPNIRYIQESSHECRQYIEWKCKDMALSGAKYALDSYEDTVTFFPGGDPYDYGSCACSVHANCSDSAQKCNCDTKTDDWQYDGGYYYSKDVELPITSFTIIANNDEAGSASLKIGQLQCYGARDIWG